MIEIVARLIEGGHSLAVVAIVFAPVFVVAIVVEGVVRAVHLICEEAPTARCQAEGCTNGVRVEDFCEDHRRKS